jgi:hypothetical protein
MAFGRVKTPRGLRGLLGKDERLLAIADDGPVAVAASQLGLWVPVEQGWRRIDWDVIVKATWTEVGLEVIEGSVDADGVVTDLPPQRYQPQEARNLPIVVRQRVERSIGRWEQVRLPGGTGRIIGRRKPGVDGVYWTARADSGTPSSEEARQILVGYLERVRALPPEELMDV